MSIDTCSERRISPIEVPPLEGLQGSKKREIVRQDVVKVAVIVEKNPQVIFSTLRQSPSTVRRFCADSSPTPRWGPDARIEKLRAERASATAETKTNGSPRSYNIITGREKSVDRALF